MNKVLKSILELNKDLSYNDKLIIINLLKRFRVVCNGDVNCFNDYICYLIQNLKTFKKNNKIDYDLLFIITVDYVFNNCKFFKEIKKDLDSGGFNDFKRLKNLFNINTVCYDIFYCNEIKDYKIKIKDNYYNLLKSYVNLKYKTNDLIGVLKSIDVKCFNFFNEFFDFLK